MPFSESLKRRVKERALFACCWCYRRDFGVDVHHIEPEAEGGSNEQDNAVALCQSHHRLLGGNPHLRKEMRQRRDCWYRVCANTLSLERTWPFGYDVPLLAGHYEIPESDLWGKGIHLVDRDPGFPNRPPVLYVAIHYGYWKPYKPAPADTDRWLDIDAQMHFALGFHTRVAARCEDDVQRTMAYLRGDGDGFMLAGQSFRHAGGAVPDLLHAFRTSEDNRLVATTYTRTGAAVSIHARLADAAAMGLADYLDEVGFSRPFPQTDQAADNGDRLDESPTAT